MSKPKVLFLSSWYPTKEDPTLGIFVKRHAQAAALYSEIALLHTLPSNGISSIKISDQMVDGFREVILEYPEPKGKLFNGFKKLLSKRKALKKGLKYLQEKDFEPDLIQLNAVFPLGILTNIYKRFPYVICEHWTGYIDFDGRFKKLPKIIQNKLAKIFKGAQEVIPVSHDLDIALRNHFLGIKTTIIPNVVNVDLFKNIPSQKASFLVVADLENNQKNICGIVNVFSQYYKSGGQIPLKIAGDGPDRTSIQKQIQANGLSEKINLLGRQTPLELNKLYNEAHALILFSNYENLPCVIIEANACGTPVIATKVGGVPEMITSENGLLLNPQDEQALLDKLLNFSKENWNPEAIQKIAQSKYSLDTIGRLFNQLYLNTLDKN